MKYILKTERNANGNLVFSKERRGQKFAYLAKDENGNVGVVDKNWILQNQKNIANLGVSGDNIYPVEVKKDAKKAIKKVTLNKIENIILDNALTYKVAPDSLLMEVYESRLKINHDYVYVVSVVADTYVDVSKLNSLYEKHINGQTVEYNLRDFTQDEKDKKFYDAVAKAAESRALSHMQNHIHGYMAERIGEYHWEDDEINKKTTMQDVKMYISNEIEMLFDRSYATTEGFEGSVYENLGENAVSTSLDAIASVIENFGFDSSKALKACSKYIDFEDLREYCDYCKQYQKDEEN